MPLFGTRVIPADARLRLEALPEEEFPIVCDRCGYLLRGLPEDRCPECGTAFDRHRLLLRSYVYGWFDALVRTTRVGRVVLWACFGGLVLVLLNAAGLAVVGLGGYWIVNQPMRPGTTAMLTKGTAMLVAVERAVWIVEGLLLLFVLIGFAWAFREIGRRLGQRRRVIDAIVDGPIGSNPMADQYTKASASFSEKR